MADVTANIIAIVVAVATAAIYLARPTLWQYLFPKQMIKAMGKFIGNIQPFSRLDSLPGIQYEAAIASKDFTYFESTKKAYDELFEALKDDSIHMIGLYGEGGCGKTSLVTQVGKQAEEQKIFDKVILITVTQTPNIRDIQEEIADMLKLKLKQTSVKGRAQQLWMSLKEKKRILIIGDSLRREFKMEDIGILLDDDDIKKTWKILITTCNKRVFLTMDCQKQIDLELLSEDESWNLFQKCAKIDDEDSTILKDVPRKICKECKRLPIAIKIVGSLFKGRNEIEWQQAYEKLMASKASDDEDNATLGIKFSYDHLSQKAKEIFLLCALFPAEKHTPTEDLVRYALGLGDKEISSLKSMRSSIGAVVKDLLDSCLLTRGSVKMHTMVRDAALWIANRSDDCKMLVNVDKPLSTVAEDNNIRDCFALSSWWFNESPFFCQLHAPNLKMLLVNISAHSSLNSLDLSPLTFEGIQGLQVFSLTINYKIVPISFPPSIQLLTNVRTLRLNGLMLGDISFIASLTSLEILDLRRCYFNELPIEIGKLESLKLIDLSECHISENNYNGVLRKCSQLEELYALPCYPEANVPNIIIDTDILPKLQRFVLTHSYFPKKKIFTELKNSNISQLKGSKMNILQMSETISLTGLHGGCNNIIPDMVGSLNNLSTFHLTECKEIKCIVDATCDLKEDDLIPRLVELCLKSLDNLTELCHGSPLQVLHYFEKLEVLDVYNCPQLYIIFPRQCNLRNLKILSLSYCRTDEVLFSESVAQSLQQLEQLTIKGSQELKHLIECPLKKKKHLIAASGSEHDGCSTSEEIVPAPMNLITNLRDVTIHNCQSLESIFPLCYVEGLPRLQMIKISYSPKLKYVFGKCDHEHLSSHQNLNQVTLPHLEVLKLGSYLNNFSGMCPANYQTNWLSQSLRILTIGTFPNVAIPWFNLNVGYDQRQHPLNEIWSFQCLERLTVGHCEQLKYLFSIESHRSLPELMYLSISHCQELEQIVAENEELVQLPNAESYFPKLKDISVYNCNNLKSLFPNKVLGQLPNAESVFPMLKNISVRDCDNLKSLFPLSMVTMLPQLSTLHLTGSTQLQVVFTHSQGDGIMNEIEIILPNLTDLALANLPNFVDICHGSKLHAVKLQRLGIFNCPKTASSLRIIEDQIEEPLDALDDYPDPYPTSSISNDVEDFIYFESTEVAYNQLLEALKDDYISTIGVYGKGGCGKTTLVTEVGKMVEELDMFEKVISITVSRAPDIRGIQGKIADMLNLKLGEESKEERAQHLWTCLKEKKRILIIVDDLWSKSHLMDIGIRLDDVVMEITLKILITTRHERVCRSIDFQKKIHLELLSEDESWNLFQKFARIDDEDSKILNDVPREICKECMGLPIAIKIVGSLFKGRNEIEWQQAFEKLRDSKAYEGGENVKLSDDDLPGKEAQQIFRLCSLFLEKYDTPTEDLVRYAHGLGEEEISSLKSMRSSIIADQVDKLLDSCLQMRWREPLEHATLHGTKLKQKKFETMNMDLAVDKDEIEEAEYNQEPFMPLFKYDIGKRIVESNRSHSSFSGLILYIFIFICNPFYNPFLFLLHHRF